MNAVEHADGEPPAQRRRLVEGNFGETNVTLYSEDNVGFPAPRNQLSAACEAFANMFEAAEPDADDKADARGLPRIRLLADSAAA